MLKQPNTALQYVNAIAHKQSSVARSNPWFKNNGMKGSSSVVKPSLAATAQQTQLVPGKSAKAELGCQGHGCHHMRATIRCSAAPPVMQAQHAVHTFVA